MSHPVRDFVLGNNLIVVFLFLGGTVCFYTVWWTRQAIRVVGHSGDGNVVVVVLSALYRHEATQVFLNQTLMYGNDPTPFTASVSTSEGIWSRLINRTSSFIFCLCGEEEQMGAAVIVWAETPAGQ